jgi:hypothetical protein
MLLPFKFQLDMVEMSEEAIETSTYSTRANNKFALTGLCFADPARADKTPDDNQVFLGR